MGVSHKTRMRLFNQKKWLKIYKIGKKSGDMPLHGEKLGIFRKIKLMFISPKSRESSITLVTHEMGIIITSNSHSYCEF